ncbi:histidine--tRNA ligase [Oceaniradius stylonematis]|uniref:histidine--tRNA ligase n=1 Tax=Oceaniradius stylonematis TaxID=2184161 RepID=UPI00273F79A6|nr:histidine--tRNA ligase [Oceaniradius stylonematis]
MSDKKSKKPQKLKARLPRGFTDRTASDIRATDEMVAKIRAVFERYGFDPVETPAFEYTDALGKFLPDQDRPNEGVFSLQDDDEQWMSLRYDLTAPLARHVAQNINEIALPYRTYRQGWVFRNEKPGPGRFRQFMQFDADTVGAPGVQADAEMAMMMADTMEALGIARGDYVIRVNNRKVLDGVMEAIGLGGEENAGRRLTVLRAIDKLDRLGIEGVRQLLGEGRKDESGDFTPGAGLAVAQSEVLINTMFSAGIMGESLFENYSADIRPMTDMKAVNKTGSRFYDNILLIDSLASSPIANDGLFSAFSSLRDAFEIIEESGYGSKRIIFDPSVVRGLEYYTGPVYEAELLFDVVNEKGETVQFGSVGGGGRYDGLVKRFTGQDVPATGFSIGVSRLMTALKNLGKLGTDEMVAPVLVTVMDGDTEALGRYQKMTQDLREAGIRAEMYQGNWKKFGNQLRYADRRGCPVAIIQGSDERERGIVQIKDMIEGRKEAAAIESNEAYRAARPGQFEVAEGDLVAEVTKLLAAQAGG